MRILVDFILIFVLFLANPVFAEKDERFAGEITAAKVNLRAGPNANFEIITQLDKGDIVRVIGKNYDWYQISLPQKASCYIDKKYIKLLDKNSGEISANNVNLRAGPGTSFNILGQLHSGTVVTVKQADEDWIEIYPPQECSGWVHKDYIKYYADIEQFEMLDQTNQQVLQKFMSIEKQYAEISQKELMDTDFLPCIIKYKDFADEYPKTEQARIASQRVHELEKKITEINVLKKNLKQENSPQAIGIIEDMGWFLSRPGTHKLIDDNDKMLYYLKGQPQSLDMYIHQRVKIWGKITPMHGRKHSLIIVEKIEQM